MKTILNPGMVEHSRFGRLFLGSTFNFSSQSESGPWLKLSNNRYGLLLPGPTKNKRDSVGVPTMTGRYRYAVAPGGTIVGAYSKTVVKTAKKSTVWSSVPYGPISITADPITSLQLGPTYGSIGYQIKLDYDPLAKTAKLTWSFPGNSLFKSLVGAGFGFFIEQSTASSELATPENLNLWPGTLYNPGGTDHFLPGYATLNYQVNEMSPTSDPDWVIPPPDQDGAQHWWPRQYLSQYPTTVTYSNVDISVAPFFIAYRASVILDTSYLAAHALHPPFNQPWTYEGLKLDYPVVGVAGGQVLSGSNNTISWTTPVSHGQLPWK